MVKVQQWFSTRGSFTLGNISQCLETVLSQMGEDMTIRWRTVCRLLFSRICREAEMEDVCVSHSVGSWLFATLWTVACQAHLSMEFSRQAYPSGLPFPSPADLPNPGLPNFRQILYQLSHQGSPRILEWVAYPFSNRSSWPWCWTGVSCIAGVFFTNWAIREAWGGGYLQLSVL